MPVLHNANPLTPDSYLDSGQYQPGVCNIGPAEIARRRMSGHVGLALTVAILIVLALVHAPAWSRLVLVIPAAISASGYLQARFHFCAGFGSRGVYNFADVGTVETVAGEEARAMDRARARQIGLASLAIGIAVAVAAALLPV